MINKNILMFVGSGLLIGGAVLGWLFSGKPPTAQVGGSNGINAKVNATMKDTVVSREKDGAKLWEFSVAELEQDRKANKVYLRGLKGKLYQKDGGHIDVTADGGEATLNKKDNNFSVSGKVKAIATDGSKVYADKIEYIEKGKFIKASGSVRVQKDDYTVWGDVVETTSEFEKFKLKGHAKIEKGGKIDD